MPRYWIELTAAQCEGDALAGTVAVLPFAAVEQHGPHLPLGTDLFIMEGYLARAAALLPPEAAVVLLPIQAIGCSLEHTAFAGTLSLPAATALQAWFEIAAGVARAGCRKIVLLSSHGGNSAPLSLLALELRAKLGFFAVQAAWSRFGIPDGLFDETEIAHGIHGGAVETSLMLAFRPELVRREAVADFQPTTIAVEAGNRWLRPGRPTGYGWMAQDLSASGAAGDATAATAEKGEACARHGARAFAELLAEIERHDPAGLPER